VIKRLKPKVSAGYVIQSPVWSPDGKKIAFVRKLSTSDGIGELVIIEEDGKEKIIKSGLLAPGLPSWSPDGKTIAYWESYKEFPNDHDVVLHNDISVVRITDLKTYKIANNASSPAWQPTRSAYNKILAPHILRPKSVLSRVGMSTTNSKVSLFGLAQPRVEVLLYRGSEKIANGSVDENCCWKIDAPLKQGKNIIVAIARDEESGRQSPSSKKATINYIPLGSWSVIGNDAKDLADATLSIPEGIVTGIEDALGDIWQMVRHPINTLKGVLKTGSLLIKDREKLTYIALNLAFEDAFKAGREDNPGVSAGIMIEAALELVASPAKLFQWLGSSEEFAKIADVGITVAKTSSKSYSAQQKELTTEDYKFLSKLPENPELSSSGMNGCPERSQ